MREGRRVSPFTFVATGAGSALQKKNLYTRDDQLACGGAWSATAVSFQAPGLAAMLHICLLEKQMLAGQQGGRGQVQVCAGPHVPAAVRTRRLGREDACQIGQEAQEDNDGHDGDKKRRIRGIVRNR